MMNFKIFIDNLSGRKLIFVLFLFAFIVRILFSVVSYNRNVMDQYNDDKAYFALGENVINQGPFLMDTAKLSKVENDVAPGIGWILSVVFLIFGKVWFPVFILNSVIGALICLLIFKIANEFFNIYTALFSFLWSSIYVHYLIYVPTAGKDIWISFFFLLCFYFIVKGFHFKTFNKYLCFLILVYVFFIHLDERFFAYLPLFALFLWMFDDIKKRGFFKAVLFSVVVLFLMIPWTIRNYKVYNKIVILSTRTSVITDKILGYSTPVNVSESNASTYSENPALYGYISSVQIDSTIKGLEIKKADLWTLLPGQAEAMKDGIIPYKFSKTEDYYRRFIDLWRAFDFTRDYCWGGYVYSKPWSAFHNLSIGLSYGILLPFFIIGLFLLFKSNRKIFFIILSIFIYHSLIHVLTMLFTQERYRLPFESLLIIVSFAAVTEIIKKIIENRKKI